MTSGVSVVVFAPGGCADADACLRLARAQAGSEDELLLVVPSGFPTECDRPGHAGWPHVAVASQDIFDLRLAALRAAGHPVVLLLEEHGLPGPGLVDQVRQAFESEPEAVALTYFSVNGTPDRLGGRLMYAWIFHGTQPAIGRSRPSPVCSTFALHTARLAGQWSLPLDRVRAGELELRVIPAAVRRCWPVGFQGAIEHHEDLGYRDAVEAVFASSRMTGHHDAHPSAGAWLARAVRRYGGNWRAGVRDGGLDMTEAVALVPVALAGLVGEAVGRWRGVGRAPEVLARHHPSARPTA